MTDPVVDWGALTRVVVGEVVVPGSPDYDGVRKPAMARFADVRPAAVVRCETPGDVAQAILFARRTGLGLSIRSGGHSVVGRSALSPPSTSRPCPPPQTTVFYLRWSFAHALALVEAWQAWAPTAPDDVDATLRLSAGADAASAQVELLGAVLAGEADARARLDALIRRAGAEPASTRLRQLVYPQAKRYLDQLDQHGEASSATSALRGHVYTKSEFFRQPLRPETIASLIRNLSQDAAGARSREIAFMPWGGAYNHPAPCASAFPHRGELFLAQHLLEADPEAADVDRDAARAWLARSWQLLRPFGSGGVYPNFPDPDLPDWQQAYHGENYGRLVRVKAAYDPDNVFRFHQSLPAPRRTTADSTERP